ncbi:helix-turn-helix domain-containing protein, partial [uncultured Megasphaera sp.]|uniref:helix-turn-helix domain-containing protein n=1 Tax=uncultured Megasphaera sp. TaxID=165188 RepID=UPI002598B374
YANNFGKFNYKEPARCKIISENQFGVSTMYDLGLRLKKLRMQRGLTQEALGKRINKSKSAICSYETNAQMPPLDVLISIATVLHVSLDQLAGLNNEKKITLAGLSAPQKDIIELLLSEFVSPTSDGPSLSPQQIQILQALILLFSNS